MGKRNAALEALAGTVTQMIAAPAADSPPSAEVVSLPVGQGPAAPPPGPAPQTVAGKARAQVAKFMVYLPRQVRRKIEEIAFYEGRHGNKVKSNDVYLAAIEKYLREKGQPAEADMLASALRKRGLGALLLW